MCTLTQVGLMRSEQYRAKAAELIDKAAGECNVQACVELESLARAYLRLAEQADRNSTNDIVYMTPDPDQDSSEA